MLYSMENELADWLTKLEWNQLIRLQRQLTFEIDRRYCDRSISREDDHIKMELEHLLKEDEKAENELPSTQDEVLHMNLGKFTKLTPKNDPTIPGTMGLRNGVELMSSPVREINEIILDSQASDILRQNDVNIMPKLRSKGSQKKRVGSPLKNSTSAQSQKKLKSVVNFNSNPITGKPWIFEDFKVNEIELSRQRKAGKSKKLAKFYAKVGSPIKDNKRLVLKDRELDYVENKATECERSSRNKFKNDYTDEESFDNLNLRSKSPPGFGRLNFPSTQERLDDKEECKKMLFNKTKERFLEATDNSIPICERNFYFKNCKLNDIVDDGNFEWNHDKLQIFTR